MVCIYIYTYICIHVYIYMAPILGLIWYLRLKSIEFCGCTLSDSGDSGGICTRVQLLCALCKGRLEGDSDSLPHGISFRFTAWLAVATLYLPPPDSLHYGTVCITLAHQRFKLGFKFCEHCTNADEVV